VEPDFQAHFDLAHAYYEMGLLSDALREVDIALTMRPADVAAKELRRLIEAKLARQRS
jgi:hypothetical protein